MIQHVKLFVLCVAVIMVLIDGKALYRRKPLTAPNHRHIRRAQLWLVNRDYLTHDEYDVADNAQTLSPLSQVPSLDTDPKISRFDCGGLCRTLEHLYITGSIVRLQYDETRTQDRLSTSTGLLTRMPPFGSDRNYQRLLHN